MRCWHPAVFVRQQRLRRRDSGIVVVVVVLARTLSCSLTGQWERYYWIREVLCIHTATVSMEPRLPHLPISENESHTAQLDSCAFNRYILAEPRHKQGPASFQCPLLSHKPLLACQYCIESQRRAPLQLCLDVQIHVVYVMRGRCGSVMPWIALLGVHTST